MVLLRDNLGVEREQAPSRIGKLNYSSGSFSPLRIHECTADRSHYKDDVEDNPIRLLFVP